MVSLFLQVYWVRGCVGVLAYVLKSYLTFHYDLLHADL